MCVDCAKVASDVPPIRRLCDYHAVVTGNGSSLDRQALAAMIDPEAFETIAASHHYFTLNSPLKPAKFSPYEARAVAKAYAAADRVSVLVGWELG